MRPLLTPSRPGARLWCSAASLRCQPRAAQRLRPPHRPPQTGLYVRAHGVQLACAVRDRRVARPSCGVRRACRADVRRGDPIRCGILIARGAAALGRRVDKEHCACLNRSGLEQQHPDQVARSANSCRRQGPRLVRLGTWVAVVSRLVSKRGFLAVFSSGRSLTSSADIALLTKSLPAQSLRSNLCTLDPCQRRERRALLATHSQDTRPQTHARNAHGKLLMIIILGATVPHCLAMYDLLQISM